jgi:hypothetical protein
MSNSSRAAVVFPGRYDVMPVRDEIITENACSKRLLALKRAALCVYAQAAFTDQKSRMVKSDGCEEA